MGQTREWVKGVYAKLNPNYRSIRRLEKRVEELSLRLDQRLDTQDALFWYSHFTPGSTLPQRKKDFFRTMPKAEGTLRTVQLVGSYMLRQLKRICEQHDITFWLSFGTLLGAARHGGFVPWDDDLDVSFLRKDFEKLRLALEQDSTFALRSYYCEEHLCYIHKLVFRGCDDFFWIDIFVWDYADTVPLGRAETWRRIAEVRDRALHDIAKTSKRFRKRYYNELLSPEDEAVLLAVFEKHRGYLPPAEEPNCIYRSLDSVYTGGETLLPLTEVFPLTCLEFEGETYPAPCQYEKYLLQVYHYLDFPKSIAGHRPDDPETAQRVEELICFLGLEEELCRMENC